MGVPNPLGAGGGMRCRASVAAPRAAAAASPAPGRTPPKGAVASAARSRVATQATRING